MNFRPLLLLFALTGAGSLWAQAPAPAAAPADLEALLKNSPFGQNATVTGGPATPGMLELRGVIVDSGETLFSVYDPASKVSRWVGLNEPGNPFTVRSYDSAKSEVKVAYQGRDVVLALKQSTVIALAAPVAPAAPGSPAPVPTAATAPGPNSDEAVRLAQIAEEIARRRALRAQGRPNNPGTPPPIPPQK